MIPVSKPFINGDVTKYAKEALDSGWISSQGIYTELATEALSKFTGIPYVLLTNNGTSAMHLVAKCLQEFIGTEQVAVPDNVYVAAWNTMLQDNYYFINSTPADINTWNVDETELIKKKPKIALIVHNLGNIINIDRLKIYLPNTIFVEDNCEGFYQHNPMSENSFCSGISFYGNKIISTGEGGAFLTRDANVYKFAKKTLGQGQSDIRFVHDIKGVNYRMTNVQAALLLGQLENYPESYGMREKVFSYYENKIKEIPNVIPQKYSKHSKWMFGVRVVGSKYQKAEKFFTDKGIEIRPMFYPMSFHRHLKVYAKIEQECNAKTLNEECIILPTYSDLNTGQQDYIINTLKEYVGSF